MTLKSIDRPVPVSVMVARQIVEAVTSGQIAVGDLLPSEHDFARDLQVSRPSVREALSALQFAGYVESRPGVGSVVVSRLPSAPFAERVGVPFPPSTLVDVLEARAVVEPQILRLAAIDPEPSALAEAKSLIEGMQLVTDGSGLEATTDLRVHLALIGTCRNQLLVRDGTELLTLAVEPFATDTRERAWASPELIRDWVEHHMHVWEAIAERNANAAERAGRAHLVSVVSNAMAATTLNADETDRLRNVVIHLTDDGSGAEPTPGASTNEATA